ncbi:MAG: TIGR02270 family protein [bacterium]|nr:TIGR02270 family protein [bacterium]
MSQLPHILSQHAEEASFQWLLRSLAVHAPHYSLKDLARLDDVVDAHLDGLRLSGDAGWRICRDELAWEEPGELFVAAFLAYESNQPDHVEAVEQALMRTPATASGLVSALGWLTWEQAQPQIQRLLDAPDPHLRRAALAAATIHRQDPGLALLKALQDLDPVVTPRALRAAGELGRRDLAPRCAELAHASHADTAFWAAWAATLLGEAAAAEALVAISETGGPHAERAAALAARRLETARTQAWCRLLAADALTSRLAVVVAGASGDPLHVPWLLEQMAVDELARPAGEAFSLLTGLDLAHLDLERDGPAGFATGPTEDAADEDVALDPDEDLPWPDPARIGAWWSQHGRRYKTGARYLLGEAVAADGLQTALVTGRQRQREAAALELTLRQPGRPLYETRARGDRQRRQLGG